MAVKEALKSRNNLPSIFIFNSCPRTLYEFTHYIWDEWRDNQTKTEKNKPRDKDDHLLENIRRLLLMPPIHIDPMETYANFSRMMTGAV